jgi:hypothetical protein
MDKIKKGNTLPIINTIKRREFRRPKTVWSGRIVKVLQSPTLLLIPAV